MEAHLRAGAPPVVLRGVGGRNRSTVSLVPGINEGERRRRRRDDFGRFRDNQCICPASCNLWIRPFFGVDCATKQAVPAYK